VGKQPLMLRTRLTRNFVRHPRYAQTQGEHAGEVATAQSPDLVAPRGMQAQEQNARSPEESKR